MNIKELIAARAASDPRLKAVLRKISDGTATLTDTAYYSDVYSDITGKMFSDNVLDLIGAEREEECIDVLRSSYDNINDICAQTQKSLDQAAAINIKPQRAPFPKERVKQIAHSLLDPTVSDNTIKRRANTGVANVSKGFHDSYIKVNAKFRNDAGLKVYINRETDGKCCEWCTAMAGRYSYGSEPDDVYRRHDNCGCTVTYENGKQRQDVWSKRSWTDPEVGAGAAEPVRFTSGNAPSGAGEPVVLTAEQAKSLQAEKQLEILTNGAPSGTIRLMKSVSVPDDFVYIKGANNNFEKFEDSDLSIDILRAIESTVSKRHDETNDFHFDSFLIAKFDSAHEKSVFITDLVERGSELKTTLYINKDFVIGKTKEQIDSMCRALKESGWWQSECIEDLIEHEIIHARLGYINGAYKADQLYDMLLQDKRVNGFCRLVDRDRSEFMNEMTVAINRGESIKKEFLDVYEEYAKGYLGGVSDG